MFNAKWDFIGHYNIKSPISIMEIGDERCGLDYSIYRDNCQIYSLEYIVSGDHAITINGEKHLAVKGDIIIMQKNSRQLYHCHTLPCHKLWVVFDGTIVETFIRAYLPDNTHVFHCPSLLSEFTEILDIAKTYHDDYNTILAKITSSLHRILIGIDREHKPNSSSSLADRIMLYIDENTSTAFILSEIAAKFNYSNNHIIIIFKKTFGMTPQQYYIRKKIEVACTYLRTSNYSLNAISDNLGFADQHYFSNTFKKIMHITPSQYRRSFSSKNSLI